MKSTVLFSLLILWSALPVFGSNPIFEEEMEEKEMEIVPKITQKKISKENKDSPESPKIKCENASKWIKVNGVSATYYKNLPKVIFRAFKNAFLQDTRLPPEEQQYYIPLKLQEYLASVDDKAIKSISSYNDAKEYLKKYKNNNTEDSFRQKFLEALEGPSLEKILHENNYTRKKIEYISKNHNKMFILFSGGQAPFHKSSFSVQIGSGRGRPSKKSLLLITQEPLLRKKNPVLLRKKNPVF